MSYSKDEIESRLRLGKGEDNSWEFKQIEFKGNKPNSPRADDLADEIAAFANTDGGVLLCSVTDNGEVLPLSGEQLASLNNHIAEISTDKIKPPVRISTHRLELADNKQVLLVEIPKGDAQHDSPGGAYIRVGSSKRKMTSDESLRLAQRRSQARYLWYDKQPLPHTGFGTLDESLWKPMLSAEGAADPKTALEKMALLALDDANVLRASVAGILLCVKSPEQHLPSAIITATHYRGSDRASGQVDAKEITGPLPQQIAEAMTFVRNNMRVSAAKMPDRMELPQYSTKAVFEAIVNAVAHRDYSIHGSRIRLSMFEDRLEIQSPGSLPNNLTVDNMAERQATRNEALASALSRMPVNGIRGSEDRGYIMERRGDGIPIIRRETYGLSGKQPEYKVIGDADVRLTIPAAVQADSAAQTRIATLSNNETLPGVNLLALFPNKTWVQAVTDAEGIADIDLHSTHLPMTVFAAAPGFAAYVHKGWVPGEEAFNPVELQPLPNGGSEIFHDATGYLPGLHGRLNPKRDTHDRTYLYASNIAINDGQQQPVSFALSEALRLTDADGRELSVRIVDIVGQAALVEYSTVP
ncbi:MAG: RNA-binding domain-containing protein [Pseudohongiellaceae bacterium]